jgi:tetratricopeptide (TPR) repeat protein
MLGYIYFLYYEGKEGEDKPMRGLNGPRLLAILLIISLFCVFRFNVRTWNMFKQTIDSYTLMAQGKVMAGLEGYKQTFSKGLPLDRDAKTAFINFVNSDGSYLIDSSSIYSLSASEAQEVIDYAIDCGQRNLTNNSQDSLMALQLSQIYDLDSQLNYDNATRFEAESGMALSLVNRSITSSPNRIPPYFIKAKIQFTRGETDDALDTVRYSIALNENYPDSYCLLARFAWVLNLKDESYLAMGRCLDLGGTEYAPMETLDVMMEDYLNGKQYDRLISLAELITRDNTGNPQIMAELAKLYSLTGNKDKAQMAASQAILLDHSLASSLSAILQ